MSRRVAKVLIGLESSGPGGAENMVLSLASGLVAAGIDAQVFTERPGWMTERAKARGLSVSSDAQATGIDWRWIVRLARRMRRERVDLFHSHEFNMNILGGAAAKLACIPHVATIHGRHWVADSPRRVWAYRAMRRLGVPIVAVSEDLRTYLAEGFGLDPQTLEVIHNGIPMPPDRIDAGAKHKEAQTAARRQLGLPDAGALLACIGNLYPVKHHACLVRALPSLPETHVAIAGRGEEENNLTGLASDLGVGDRLHLLGLLDDVVPLLCAADVFVHPSLSEGLPLAVLEAMAHGLPIVASRVGGIPEAIEAGVSGALVPPDDADALAETIAQILESPERSRALAQQARARAIAEFSVDTMVDRYQRLYSAVGGS